MKKSRIIFFLVCLLMSCSGNKDKHNFYIEGDEVCFVADPNKKGVVVYVKKPGATYRVSYFDINGKNVEDVFAAYELCDCK